MILNWNCFRYEMILKAEGQPKVLAEASSPLSDESVRNGAERSRAHDFCAAKRIPDGRDLLEDRAEEPGIQSWRDQGSAPWHLTERLRARDPAEYGLGVGSLSVWPKLGEHGNFSLHWRMCRALAAPVFCVHSVSLMRLAYRTNVARLSSGFKYCAAFLSFFIGI